MVRLDDAWQQASRGSDVTAVSMFDDLVVIFSNKVDVKLVGSSRKLRHVGGGAPGKKFVTTT